MANGKTKTQRAAKWEQIMATVDGMIAASNGHLFDRATALVAIWHDPEFLAFHDGDVDAAEEHLNQKLGDYGLSFFDVKAMLDYYTTCDQWSEGNLREMLAYALEQEEAKRERVAAPQPQRKGPVPRREFEQLQKHSQFVQTQAESFQAEVQRLRQENEQLRAEVNKAYGRIAELERIVERDFASSRR